MTDDLSPARKAAALAEDARVVVGELRGAWEWLTDMAIPGRAAPAAERLVSAEQAAIEAEQVRRDRRAAHAALSGRYPKVPPGPHADAARVGPLAARTVVAKLVKRLAERLWSARHDGAALPWPVVDPRLRQTTMGCWYCDRRGVTALVGPDGRLVEGTCPQCRGATQVPTGHTCGLCGALAACPCGFDDAYFAVGLAAVLAELAGIADPDLAADALATLERCNRAARRAAGAAEVELILKAACPACGRRDLVAECSSPNRAEWTIRCRHPLCRCVGAGCGCTRLVRYQGKRHVWPAGEWDGPGGLAARLGVDLPGTARPEGVAS